MKLQITHKIEQELLSILMAHMEAAPAEAKMKSAFFGTDIYIKEFDETVKSIKKEIPSASDEDLRFSAFLLILYKTLDSDSQRATEYLSETICNHLRFFTASDYINNPYYKNIHFDDVQQGDYILTHDSYKKYEITTYNTSIFDDLLYIQIPRLGIYLEGASFPSVFSKSKNRALMTITENEIYTMEEPIQHAKGNVLMLGCGLGYFAYMASLKETVNSITIVELEQDIIDLFEKNILPQFEHKEKIHIIKADAISYLKNLEDGKYDYCFADIWLGADEIDLYFAVKEIGRTFRKMKIDYWIEDAFMNYLASYVFLEMLDTYSKISESQFSFSLSQEIFNIAKIDKNAVRSINYLHRLFKNVEIKKPQQIAEYLKPSTLLHLINKTKINF